MKKQVILFLAFICQLSSAQTNRFIYEVRMKPDATDKTSEFIERAYLDISPEKSVFYGEKRMLRDSVIDRMRTTQNWDRSQFQDLRSKIDFIVEKDLTNQKITFKQRIARDNFEYDEERKMVWKILPETTKIGEYKVQKAETEFAGRVWTAWFAQELPYQDGPYKFSGLPGLIIKIEDEDGDYSFDLEQSKKIAQPSEFLSRGNVVKLKRKDFIKQQDRFKKDPMSAFTSGGGRGNWKPDPQRMKEMETRIKEEIAKNNNPIEME